MADVGRLAKELAATKITTERVEVDDDSAPPTVAANSSEEKALLKELSELLPEALKAVPDATKLMCLRGRKYDPARGAETLQALEALKETLQLSNPPPQLAADIASGKVTNPGGVDEMGRSIIWLRLRFNKPKESSPQDMGRLVATVMLKALESVETQRNGIVLINDMRELSVKNLSPSIAKFLMGEVYAPMNPAPPSIPAMTHATPSRSHQVLPALPIRVHRILIVRPPWFINRSVSPFLLPCLLSYLPTYLPTYLHPYLLSTHSSLTHRQGHLPHHVHLPLEEAQEPHRPLPGGGRQGG